mmetsp:Transcript_21115/g.50000  ORF Transcript_21115/g.50000 Transcript_21115/m.50000 type:complete len:221 (+) Transcript_21115:1364-2026(+)
MTSGSMPWTGLLGVKRCTSVTQLSELRGMLLSNASESIGTTGVRWPSAETWRKPAIRSMTRVAAPCCARVEMARGPTSSLLGGGPSKSLARLSAAAKASTRRLTAILAASKSKRVGGRESFDALSCCDNRGSKSKTATTTFLAPPALAGGGGLVPMVIPTTAAAAAREPRFGPSSADLGLFVTSSTVWTTTARTGIFRAAARSPAKASANLCCPCHCVRS